MTRFLLFLLSCLIATTSFAAIPKLKDFDIAAFGAIADGKTNNTTAIQRCIDAASKNKRGGRVVIGAGCWLTGTIELKSNVILHLEQGALLLGSTNPYDYDCVDSQIGKRGDEDVHQGLIISRGAKNIGIMGQGTIDAQGLALALAIDSLHHIGERLDPNYNVRRQRPSTRPKLLFLDDTENIIVNGVHFRNSAGWGLSFHGSTNISITDIDVYNRAYWNNDGIDINDCRNVTISHCNINSADDGICLKSDNAEGMCQDINIENCRIASSASAVKFGTSSYGGFRNISIRNIDVYDTFRSAIALESVDGAILENILVDSITAVNTGNPIFIRLGARHGLDADGKDLVKGGTCKGICRNITIRNVKAQVPFSRPDEAYDLRGPEVNYFHNPWPSSITGLPGHCVENVTLENIEIEYPGRATKGMAYIGLYRANDVPEKEAEYPEFSMFGELPSWAFYVRHVRNIAFRNIKVTLKDDDFRPAFVFDDVKGLKLEDVNQPDQQFHYVQKDYLQYVDPMIGTGAHYSADAAGLWGVERKQKPLPTSKLGTMAGYDKAHDPGQCIPAVLMPHGMNFWVAQTEDTEQKEIAPYYYKDEEIQGFRNSHWIVGGMTQDYGSFTLMPLGKQLITNPLSRASRFSHAKEVSTPSYYSVYLERYGVKAEMTATSRAAIFRFTYKEAGDVYLVVNPNSDERQASMSYNPATQEITGSNPAHRIYQGWGEYAGFDGHFVLKVNKPVLKGGVTDSTAYVMYHVEAGETVVVKAASSFTDIAHAKDNLSSEIPHWDFDTVRNSLTTTWQQQLGRVEAESKDTTLLKNFYTALYHASFLPREFNDCDGSYPAFAQSLPDSIKINHTSDIKPNHALKINHTSGTYYEDYSLWDTYRALHPLMCILEPQRAGDMVQSLLDKYDDGGWLPIFPCWNSYTSEMIGDPACSLVADAYFKGIRNFNINKAYEALKKNAYEQPSSFAEYEQGKGRRALTSYLKYGYIPVQDEVAEAYHKREQTSRTMEYAYDDYVFSLFARDLGYTDIADDLLLRSRNYKNVYNSVLGWVDGRNADGSWLNGNPFEFQKYITEGKPCHYTWYVPHDIPGLASLMGGNDAFSVKLDSIFEGGRYWHGNEPCHQIAYLYDYVGKPEKTQYQVRNIMSTEYHAAQDGLAGNDDAGQMSAWYIFSAMGFYPVCPGVPEYAIGSPCFDRLVIHNTNGHDFTIIAEGASDKNIYIKKAELNGRPFNSYFLRHEDILNGGTLRFVMSR